MGKSRRLQRSPGKDSTLRGEVLPNRSEGQVQQRASGRCGACFVPGTVLGAQYTIVFKTWDWSSMRLPPRGWEEMHENTMNPA